MGGGSRLEEWGRLAGWRLALASGCRLGMMMVVVVVVVVACTCRRVRRGGRL